MVLLLGEGFRLGSGSPSMGGGRELDDSGLDVCSPPAADSVKEAAACGVGRMIDGLELEGQELVDASLNMCSPPAADSELGGNRCCPTPLVDTNCCTGCGCCDCS